MIGKHSHLNFTHTKIVNPFHFVLITQLKIIFIINNVVNEKEKEHVTD